jgi:hypothetical protein
MSKQTFKDLMTFQKLEIIGEMAAKIEEGQTFNWTNSPDNVITLSKVSSSSVTITNGFDACHALEAALSLYNRAPDNHQLSEFLNCNEVAA